MEEEVEEEVVPVGEEVEAAVEEVAVEEGVEVRLAEEGGGLAAQDSVEEEVVEVDTETKTF